MIDSMVVLLNNGCILLFSNCYVCESHLKTGPVYPEKRLCCKALVAIIDVYCNNIFRSYRKSKSIFPVNKEY